MISGKNINLKLFQNENEILELYNSYNNLSERDENDHTEIYAPVSMIKKFRESGLWSKEEGTLLVTSKKEKIYGSIGFTKIDEFTLEIGFRIFNQENRKKGYMGEALSLFSAYLFETVPGITRLEIRTAVENIGSRTLAENCGYKLEGILRQAYFFRGKITDFAIYSILRNESLSMQNDSV